VAAAGARWIQEPPAGWEALLRADPGAGPSHRPALARAFAAALPGMEAAWIAVTDGEGLAGGAAVMIERRAGFHWLHAMPFLLGGAPLARAGAHAAVDRAVAEALESRARMLGAVGGEWVLYRPDGPEPDAATVGALSGETRRMESAIVDLEAGIETAWWRVDRDRRQAIARARSAGLTFAESPESVEEAYSLHVAQVRKWAGHRPAPLDLWRRLLAPAGDGPAARLFTVRDGRGMLAAVLALVSPREVLAWRSGMHPHGRAAHAFPLLLWALAEWTAAAGCARLNLGASAGREELRSFKHDLGARAFRYPARWMGAAHAGAAGRALAALQRRVRRGRPRGEPA
jgi:hypothetical protein